MPTVSPKEEGRGEKEGTGKEIGGKKRECAGFIRGKGGKESTEGGEKKKGGDTQDAFTW